jgi:hypothetical protein
MAQAFGSSGMTLLGGGGLHYDFFHSLYVLRLRGFYQGSSETFLVTIIREGDRGAHAKAESRDWTISLWLFSYILYSISNCYFQ